MTQARLPSARTLRRRMVEALEAGGSLTRPDVRKALLAVPRERFLPGTPVEEVYADKAVVTRTDTRGAPTSSSSQPAIMAIMLERLELRPGHRVLEIGAGTGYNAALLSTLVGGSGSVVSVELQADLAAAAGETLAAGGYPAQVVHGDGRDGWPAAAPYDRITLTASTGAVHRSWFEQLAPGGLLQLPLHLQGPDLQAVVTFRKEGDHLRSVDVTEGGFMAIRDPQLRPLADHASGVSLSEHVDGRHRSFGGLAGNDIRRLTPTARRRLAEVMLERPARRRLGRRYAGGSPFLFVRLAKPKGAVALSYHRSGQAATGYGPVATAALDGRGLAVLAPAAGTLELFGDRRAGEVMADLLDTWLAAGRPGLHDLRVDVRFPPDGGPVLRTTWPPKPAGQSSTVSSRR